MNRQLHRQTVDRTPFEAQVAADRQNIIYDAARTAASDETAENASI